MTIEVRWTYCGRPEPTVECSALGFCDYHQGVSPDEAEACSPEAVERWREHVERLGEQK